MTHFDSDYHVALERTPECARRIGIIIGLFAAVESQLPRTFASIANIELDLARVSLESHKQFSNRVAYLASVLSAIQPNWPRDKEAGELFVAGLRIASKIRNKYAHSTYGWTGHPGSETLFLRLFEHQSGYDGPEEIATIDILDDDISFFKMLIDAMQTYSKCRATGNPFDPLPLQQAITRAKPRRPRSESQWAI